MSILSVDTIQPIGSGSTVTLNAAKIVVGTGITFESNGQAIYAGIITATSFSGSGANLTSLPAQATIANNADNRIITGGSGVNLNGEANFTFDGTIATIQNSGAVSLNIGSTNAGGASITLDGDSNGDFSGNDYALIRHTTDGHLQLHTKNPAGASNVFIQMGTSGHYGAMFKEGAESLLRYNNSTKIETTNTGALITGICTATTFEATTFSKTPTNTPAFHAWSNNVTSHSISDSTWTKVQFLNSETFDTDSAYDNSTSGTTANRFTVPSGKGGFYQVNAGLNFYANVNDIRGIIARIQQNGATKITQYGFISSYAAGTRHFQVNLGGVLSLAAGDYLELFGWLDTNGNSQGYWSNDANGYRGNFFSAYKLII